MNAGKAVYGILSTNAEVPAIVGTKIFPEVAEQETALPSNRLPAAKRSA